MCIIALQQQARQSMSTLILTRLPLEWTQVLHMPMLNNPDHFKVLQPVGQASRRRGFIDEGADAVTSGEGIFVFNIEDDME